MSYPPQNLITAEYPSGSQTFEPSGPVALAALATRSGQLSYLNGGGPAWLASYPTLYVPIPALDAYIAGVRVSYSGGIITVPASSDTYVDLNQLGQLIVTSVANGITSGFSLNANAVRVVKLVSNGTSVTITVVNAKDATGAWIGNASPLDYCYLGGTSFQAYTTGLVTLPWSTAANEVLDNNNLHSTSVNPTRITLKNPGGYKVSGAVFNSAPIADTQMSIYYNGSVIPNGQFRASGGASIYSLTGFVPAQYFASGYFELAIASSVAGSCAGGWLSIERVF